MAILTLLKQTGLQVTKDLTGLLLIKAVTGLQLIHQWTGLLLLILLVQRIITVHNTHRFSNSFSTNRFTRIQRHFIKLFRTLKNDKSVTIYHRNLQTLVYEAFKIKKTWRPKYWQTFFPTRNTIIMSKIAQGCRVELLKLSLMPQKLYLVWNQKYETFYQASYIIKTKKSWMGLK